MNVQIRIGLQATKALETLLGLIFVIIAHIKPPQPIRTNFSTEQTYIRLQAVFQFVSRLNILPRMNPEKSNLRTNM